MVSLPRGGQEARKNRAVGSGWYGSSAPASEWGVSFTRLAQLSSNMVKQTLTEPAKWLLFKEKIPVVCSTDEGKLRRRQRRFQPRVIIVHFDPDGRWV